MTLPADSTALTMADRICLPKAAYRASNPVPEVAVVVLDEDQRGGVGVQPGAVLVEVELHEHVRVIALAVPYVVIRDVSDLAAVQDGGAVRAVRLYADR